MSSSEPLQKLMTYVMFFVISIVLIFATVMIYFGIAIMVRHFIRVGSTSNIWMVILLLVFSSIYYIASFISNGIYSLKVTKEINLLIKILVKYVIPIIVYLWVTLEPKEFLYWISIPHQSFSFSITVIIVALVYTFILDIIFEKITKKPKPEVIY